MASGVRNKLFYGWVILIILFIFGIILFGLNFPFDFTTSYSLAFLIAALAPLATALLIFTVRRKVA